MASSILYPPVIDATMPAFVFDDNHPTTRVYFSISDYNSLENFAREKVGTIIEDASLNKTAVEASEQEEGAGENPYLHVDPILSENNIATKTYEEIIHLLYDAHNAAAATEDEKWIRVEMPDGPYRSGYCPNSAFNLSNGQYDYWSYLIYQGDKGLQILTDIARQDSNIKKAHLDDNWRVTPDMLNWTPVEVVGEPKKWYCYIDIQKIKNYIEQFTTTKVDYEFGYCVKSRRFIFKGNDEVIDDYAYPYVMVTCKESSTNNNMWTNTNSSNLGYSNFNLDASTRFYTLHRDNVKYITGDKNCYYIEIDKNDIDTNNHNNYNIQIRFVSKDANKESWPIETTDWINANINNFSEWSSVCLLRRLNNTPLVTIANSSIGYNDEGTEIDFVGTIIDSHFIRLNVSVNSNNDDEYLSAYRLRLYSNSEKFFENPLEDSGWQKIKSNTSLISYEINYNFKRLYDKNTIYYLYVDIQTNNGYSNSLYSYTYQTDENVETTINSPKVDVKISSYNVFSADIQLDTVPNYESGEILVRIWNKHASFDGNLILIRTSSESSFEEWDTLLTFENVKDVNCIYWVDRTISCDEWYRYAVIYGNMFTYHYEDIYGDNHVTTRYIETDPVMAEEPVNMFLDDSFLVGEHKSLKIKFDPNINSFKWKVTESSIETLGSKYPFFNRNAVVNYRTFPISGTIATWMDDEQNFVNREELFNPKAYGYHMDFTRENRIEAHYDWVLEKKFRDALAGFLMSTQPRLFKSLTEGNVLVRIHDVSFTPNKTLGRLIWSFSATATEIGEASLENINKYGIQENVIQLNFNDIGDTVYDPPYNKDEDLMVLPNGFYIMQEKEIKDFTISLIGKENTEKYCIRMSRPSGGSAGGEADKLDEFGAPLPEVEP